MNKPQTHFTDDDLKDLNGKTSTRHGFILPFEVLRFLKRMEYHVAGILIFSIAEYVKHGNMNDIKKGLPEKLNNSTDEMIVEMALEAFEEIYISDADKYLGKVKRLRLAGAKGGKANA